MLSTAPIVDPQRWAGFDKIVKLNDAFFMPLMFLLSGLFVWHGLLRKGAWPYLRGRLIRLGVPLVLGVLTIVPLAYYPSFRQAGGPRGRRQAIGRCRVSAQGRQALLAGADLRMGLINLSDAVRLYPSTITAKVQPRRVALIAQSGSAAIHQSQLRSTSLYRLMFQ